jgi:hypothetical protein
MPFFFGTAEAKIPQPKRHDKKNPILLETKKPSKMLGFFFGIDDLSVC